MVRYGTQNPESTQQKLDIKFILKYPTEMLDSLAGFYLWNKVNLILDK